jgi:hypothetical protein
MKIEAVLVGRGGSALAYETDDVVKVGDSVWVPRPYFLVGVNDEYGPIRATVTRIGTEYKGACRQAVKDA